MSTDASRKEYLPSQIFDKIILVGTRNIRTIWVSRDVCNRYNEILKDGAPENEIVKQVDCELNIVGRFPVPIKCDKEIIGNKIFIESKDKGEQYER
jgi:hypothetical protein